jgi:hypothetical protein
MTQRELFTLMNSLNENARRKQWDIVEKVIVDTLWASADKDWKAANRHILEQNKTSEG